MPTLIQNNEMIAKAEGLRDEYYLIKMLPRPKYTKKVVQNPKEETVDEELDLDGQEKGSGTNSEDEDQDQGEDTENPKEDL